MTEAAIILKAKYVWDGVHEKPIPEGAVLIEDSVIKGVGPFSELLTAREAQILEFPDSTVLPGLIDSHTHLSMDGSLSNYLDHMTDPVPQLTLRSVAMMRKDLAAGVTTCRCLGDKEFLDIACRQAVERGEFDGPRLLVATRGIRSPEGHGFVGYPFKGVEEIRNAIRENIRRGADFTKIYITGTLKGNSDLPPYLSREEIQAAIEESHRAGKPVASHCVGGKGLDWALELGLDTVEHAYHITQEQTDHLARSGTSLVLTPGAVLSDERVKRLPKHLIDGHLRERDRMFEAMALTVQAGIPFGVGTDGMHGDLVEDIYFLSMLGATNHRAMQAATIHGATICGIEKETGSLEPGKDADVVVVEGDPMMDLRQLRNVLFALKKGKVVHPISQRALEERDFVYGLR